MKYARSCAAFSFVVFVSYINYFISYVYEYFSQLLS